MGGGSSAFLKAGFESSVAARRTVTRRKNQASIMSDCGSNFIELYGFGE